MTVPDLTKTAKLIRRQYPQTYGKVQSAHPARWLTRDEAFSRLIGACQTGTWSGSRDELAVRMGLMGCRAEDAFTMTMANLVTTGPEPTFSWIGKKRRPRQVVLGSTFYALLTRYLDEYTGQLGRPLQPTDPILCRNAHHGGTSPTPAGTIRWGQPMAYITYYQLIRRRARLAGLGNVSPHDLRRTAAGILHRDTDESGAHRFDLLDIQKVLDHADPATTMRSYLDPMDNAVKARAATVLD